MFLIHLKKLKNDIQRIPINQEIRDFFLWKVALIMHDQSKKKIIIIIAYVEKNEGRLPKIHLFLLK